MVPQHNSNNREVKDLLLRLLCLCRKNSLAPLTFAFSGDDDPTGNLPKASQIFVSLSRCGGQFKHYM
jgi:hypothetical protein